MNNAASQGVGHNNGAADVNGLAYFGLPKITGQQGEVGEELEKELEEAYSREDGLADGARLAKELEAKRAELESLYAEWEEISAKLEEGS